MNTPITRAKTLLKSKAARRTGTALAFVAGAAVGYVLVTKRMEHVLNEAIDSVNKPRETRYYGLNELTRDLDQKEENIRLEDAYDEWLKEQEMLSLMDADLHYDEDYNSDMEMYDSLY